MRLLEKIFGKLGFVRKPLQFSVSYASTNTEITTRTFSVPITYSVEEVLSWRIKFGWSRKKLARKSGLTVREIELLETNWKTRPLSFMTALAKAYGTTKVIAPSFDFVEINKAIDESMWNVGI